MIAVLFLSFPVILLGQSLIIEVNGDANFTNMLAPITEAGNDFPSSLESESSVFVSVLQNNQLDKKKNQNQKWRVFIHKMDMTWNSNLILEARRTGNGSRPNNPGNPNISNGENFQQVTDISSYFFEGRSEIIQIPLALKLAGFSVTMGARDYETNIVLTVYDD